MSVINFDEEFQINPDLDEFEVKICRLGRFYRVKSSSFKKDAVVRIYDTHSEALIYSYGICDSLASLGYYVRLIDESVINNNH